MKKTIAQIQGIFATLPKFSDGLLLLIRLRLAIVFIQTGFGKLMDLPSTTMFFTTLGIPFPHINAILASSTELFGGIALLIGLCTRLATLPLIGTMIVAILTAQLPEIEGPLDLFGLQEWDYMVMFLVLFVLGAGKLSVDHWLAKKLLSSKENTDQVT